MASRRQSHGSRRAALLRLTGRPPWLKPRRRLCAWCRRDLGAIPYRSREASYGICGECIELNFAHLYDPGDLAPPKSGA